MARLYSCGFEYNTTATNFCFENWGTSGTGSKFIGTGRRSVGAIGFNSGTGYYYGIQNFYSSNTQGKIFVRFYLKITNNVPLGTRTLFRLSDSTQTYYLTLNVSSTYTVSLFERSSSIYGDTNIWTLGAWHRVELHADTSDANNVYVELRWDGITLHSETLTNWTGTTGLNHVRLGILSTQSNMNFYYDDLAINDGTGTAQTNWPGEGNIVLLLPEANGDSSQWTRSVGLNNYETVDEDPPNTTDYNSSNTVDQVDMYNYSTLPSNVSSSANINLVEVGCYYAGASSSNNATFRIQLEKTSGGTIAQSSDITPTSTSYTYLSASPQRFPIIAYKDPDGNNWTASNVGSLQAGVKVTTGNTNAAHVSALPVQVEVADFTMTDVSSISNVSSIGA